MIRVFDMFSGIGGFRAGLEAVGGFEFVGHCEIDRFAEASYRANFDTEGEKYFEDATKIVPQEVPNFDLVCAGFPCQSFSQAGLRRGFDDARGTMFFEIARLVSERKPKYILLENVPGLLNHDKGKTFSKILGTLSELRYHVEWNVLNSKDFGVPQSRKRVFIIGFLDSRCAGKIFPIRSCNSQNLKQVVGGSQGQRVYDPSGISCTLASNAGGQGGKTGLYWVDMNLNGLITEFSRCIKSRYNSGITKRIGENSGILELFDEPMPILTPGKENKRQNGKRFRLPGEPMFTLTGMDRHGIFRWGRIRKLTPWECLRLQGFSEKQADNIMSVNSDNQVYKQAGNSVTVNVIQAIGTRMKKLNDELEESDNENKCESESY